LQLSQLAWLKICIYTGNNQDPAFIEKIRKQISTRSDWPRHIIDDQGFFEEV